MNNEPPALINGLDDLIIGAPFTDLNGNNTGASYVVFGDQLLGQAMLGDEMANILTGNAVANQLIGGLGDDTLIGEGGADVLRGGGGDDVLAIRDSLFASIDGGLGSDTLRFDEAINLDPSRLAHIRSIENIDLASDSGNSTLNLNLSDVLAISAQTTLMNPLSIGGTSNDIVNLLGAASGGIAGSWAEDAGGDDIYTYTATSGNEALASILIDDAITVNII